MRSIKILVTGATGTVGSGVLAGLIRTGHAVRALTRSPHKLTRHNSKVEITEGSLSDKNAAARAMAGVDAVFLLTPVAPDETEQGLNGVEAAKAAGVRRIVYLTVHRLEEGRHIPHFASKIPVVEAIRASGLEYALLEPNNFFQNDLWLEDPIRQFGVYPQPLGSVGLSRVDARDIADAGVRALTEDGFSGAGWPLVGPDVLTGEDCARIWSAALGREIQYVGDDLDSWEKQAELMLPPWLVHDLRIMYAHFQEHGQKAAPEELALSERITGHPMRRFEDFAAEVAAQWS